MFVNNLKNYKIVLTLPAKKALFKINPIDAKKIETKLKDLVAGIQNLDIKKIVSKKYPTYRLRIGNYRVLYEVHQKAIIVKIIRISHRKEAYKF